MPDAERKRMLLLNIKKPWVLTLKTKRQTNKNKDCLFISLSLPITITEEDMFTEKSHNILIIF